MTKLINTLSEIWRNCTTFDETAPYYKMHAAGMQQVLPYHPHR